jgi:phosphohistidine swiveling domain-containing protein
MEQTAHAPSMAPAAPKPIPTPPDFPVQWRHPDEAMAFWTRDLMHFGGQIMPLEGEQFRRFMDIGFTSAARQMDLPVHFIAQRINTYFYQALVPFTTDHDEMEAIGKRSEQTIGAAIGRLPDAWQNEYLPEIQRYIADWDAFDLRGASLPQLMEHLDTSVERVTRLMEMHFQIAIPMLLAMSLYDELYADLFGGEDKFAAYQLLQGFPNKSVEAGHELWKLSRRAVASDTVRRVLEEESTADVIPALQQSDEGCAFLGSLQSYLEAYGKRANTWFILSETPWIDDPTPVVRTLKDYVGQKGHDPEAEVAALVAEREKRLAEIRAQLAGYPELARGQFEFFLRAAQLSTVLQEDHNFWIDYRSTYELRRVVMEVGRRFAEAGALDAASDILYLDYDEMKATAADLPNRKQQAVVAERKAEMARFATIQPPFALGSEPPGPPPDNPVGRAIGKFFGGPPQESEEPGSLKGNAGSKGVVRGTAKVIRSLAEAGKLQQGDILVAETTAPAWTPLFAIAAAVVTDTGGILSHCAVVAREYMIPAVVGIGMATHVIQDGQLLEVDGTEGIVRVIG